MREEARAAWRETARQARAKRRRWIEKEDGKKRSE
jgi:hypothetical protein